MLTILIINRRTRSPARGGRAPIAQDRIARAGVRTVNNLKGSAAFG